MLVSCPIEDSGPGYLLYVHLTSNSLRGLWSRTAEPTQEPS